MTTLGRLRAVARRRPHADIAVALVVFAATMLTTAAGPGGGGLDGAATVTAAISCGALAARHRFPATVMVICAIAAEAYLMHFQSRHGSTVLAAPLIALYTVAEISPRRGALLVGVLTALAFGGVHAMVRQASWLGADTIALAALGGLAVAAGAAARHRHAYLAEVEARARHAEADRDAEADRLVTEERLRIARDLHDVVGHHLALIHVQAGVAAHVLDGEPDRARRALAHVTTASRAALGALSSTIGLLRQPEDATVPTEPVPGLAGVGDLLAGFRRSGLQITERVDGPAGPVPPAVDLTAYRIIQESLTNVCKHVGPTEVEVQIAYGVAELRIVVDNQPAAVGVPAAGRGHGLTGMRERVAAIGGALHAGPRPGGGFRVAATLPTFTPTSAPASTAPLPGGPGNPPAVAAP
jgi:signal transduction histidine kinase